MAVDQAKSVATKDRISQWQSRSSHSTGSDSALANSPSVVRKVSLGKPGPPSESPSPSMTDISEQDIKSPKVLKKKIQKTQALMKDAEEKEKKGRESKLFCRLSEKLKQYETELAASEAAQDEEETKVTDDDNKVTSSPTKTPKSPGSISKGKRSSISSISKKTSFSLSEEDSIHSDRPSTPTSFSKFADRASEVSSPGTGSTPYDRPTTLQKKIKKVEKMMADIVKESGEKAKEKKLYKKYEEKLAEYKTALKEFEGRMKIQAKDGKLLIPAPPLLTTTTKKKKSKDPSKSPKAKSKAKVLQQPDGADALKDFDEEAKPKPKKKNSSRSGPKKKTTRVSAARIQELDKLFKPEFHEKDKAAEDLIREEIKNNFIFNKLNDRSVNELVKAFEPTHEYSTGELIIQQGEMKEPMYFYIIGSGGVDFEVFEKKVGSAGVGKSFGEQGLLYSCARKASVRANSPTQLYRLDQITFRYVLQNQTKFQKAWRQATRKIMAMNRLLGAAALKKMVEADSEDEKEDEEGEMMLKEEASQKYDISKDFDDSAKGSFHLGQLDDEGDDDMVGSMIGRMSKARLSMQNSFHETRVSLEHFNRESVLGEGQFGEVWKVKPNIEELKDQDFALKIQAKDDVMREASGMTITVAQAIERECEILSQFCHPFICEFVHKFEDDDNIYLVMGVIRGMELWNVVHRELDDGEWESGIPEENAKFYGALIADTLRYMHRQKICYRDLKPENIMVAEDGYIVFVDFGFAKHIPSGQTFTFCGTPNYTCPEIISNQGHGFPVDWWAFGVVVYEMVSGENPFYYDGIPEMQLLEDITNNEPEPLGDDVSEEVKDLVSKLLIKDPEKRFGTANPGDILKHPWFDSIDIAKGRDKLLTPPFFPPIEDDQ